ncbi:MAG TPA: ABC transporter permease [Pseudonocardiaceae bacterium]|jgi:peptide/nickel transport system permease protein|nr:ABC transporter permease [Pseudonocardiaceae bacterium]
MRRLVIQRLLLSIPLPFVVSIMTFLLVALTPGDLARTILGGNATQAQYLQLRQQLGLNEPLWTRYWHWLTAALHGDLGLSATTSEPVTTVLNARLGPTLSLVIGSTLVAAVLGILLGVGGAVRAGALGRLIDGFSLIGLALPNFWLGLILIGWFAVDLRLFPASGYASPGDSLNAWATSLVLPVVTLAAPGVAIIARQTRDAMRDTLQRPFMRTLRAAGLSRRSLLLRHALRNSAIPVLTVTGVVFVGALSGTVIAETVFALPGLGGEAVAATQAHDVPLIQGVALYFTFVVIIVNLVIDIAYGYLDPRVRVS